jgi:hypothetical protein
MTTTIHISDFKDFAGLQEACNYYNSSIIEKSNTRFTFDNVNPFDKIKHFKGYYNEALLMAKENGFEMQRVEFLLNTLKNTGLELITAMETRLCYSENHIKRQL